MSYVEIMVNQSTFLRPGTSSDITALQLASVKFYYMLYLFTAIDFLPRRGGR